MIDELINKVNQFDNQDISVKRINTDGEEVSISMEQIK